MLLRLKSRKLPLKFHFGKGFLRGGGSRPERGPSKVMKTSPDLSRLGRGETFVLMNKSSVPVPPLTRRSFGFPVKPTEVFMGDESRRRKGRRLYWPTSSSRGHLMAGRGGHKFLIREVAGAKVTGLMGG